MRASTTVELSSQEWRITNTLFRNLFTDMATSQQRSYLTPVSLSVRLHSGKTVVCAGRCCSLCVQLLLLYPFSSPVFWFIVRKKLKNLKLISKDLKQD
ncbi:hypothetical protein FQN60_012015 [Etheostoma spectabile]|uniref:Uncharacterized protein n=1 Tax=Etheostoma spectabile TaxID=54343 RepID=A0A5J5DNQ6_9PERO|nr:hypothetical protein FQN60_012015 [Etheostoma spectabile]